MCGIACIEKLYLNKELYRNNSFHNYAKERFWTLKIATRLEKIYQEVLQFQ